jgi:hypothetical protein
VLQTSGQGDARTCGGGALLYLVLDVDLRLKGCLVHFRLLSLYSKPLRVKMVPLWPRNRVCREAKRCHNGRDSPRQSHLIRS